MHDPSLTYYPGAGHAERHGDDSLRGRRLRAAGDGQRGGRPDAAADAAGRRGLCVEVSARGLRSSGAAAGRAAGDSHGARRARRSSAFAPIASACLAHRPAGTWRRRRRRGSMPPKAGPARRSMRSARRPDFVALLYPVVTMQAPFAHADSRRNLLGASPSPAAGRSPVDRIARASGHAAVLHRAHLRGSLGADRKQHGAGAGAARAAGCRSSRTSTRRARTVSASIRIWARRPNGRPALEQWLAAHGFATRAGHDLSRRSLGAGGGIEGQRKADLGNGTFLNPIMPAIIPTRRS